MTSPVRFALTTPLYYVNDVPHIGSAYTTMVADAIARFHRLKGDDVLFITGTDEHGQKIQRTAQEKGVDPQVHCDEIIGSFKDLWQHYNIQYDRFSRTTAPNHAKLLLNFSSGSGTTATFTSPNSKVGIALPAKNLKKKKT